MLLACNANGHCFNELLYTYLANVYVYIPSISSETDYRFDFRVHSHGNKVKDDVGVSIGSSSYLSLCRRQVGPVKSHC